MQPAMPKHASWAAGIHMAMGVVLLLCAGLVVTIDASTTSRVVGGTGVALVGGALVLLGWRLRRRDRVAHRIAVVLAALQLVFGVVGLVRGWAGLPWLPAVMLWLLLRAPTRRWFDGVPDPHLGRPWEEPSLAEINRRFAERPITRD